MNILRRIGDWWLGRWGDELVRRSPVELVAVECADCGNNLGPTCPATCPSCGARLLPGTGTLRVRATVAPAAPTSPPAIVSAAGR